MVKQEMSEFSVIITASSIPSHPSTKIIDETLKSLKYISKNQNFPIILAHDFSSEQKYIKYLKIVENYSKKDPRITSYVRSNHGHLVGNIRNIIDKITTKYILVIQHDFPFIREFEIDNIIEDMELESAIKYVRFNKRHNLKEGFDSISYIFGHQTICKNYRYTRTPTWSDNNHLCKTDYYKNLILIECKDGTAMERTLYKRPSTEEGHKKYGTYLFGEYNAFPTIRHSDGRNSK